jgi:Flavodoxins
MMKPAIVYVTRTGHCRTLAEMASRIAGGRVWEIGDKERRNGFFGFIRSGRQSTFNMATPIEDPNADLRDIDTLILVTPIWAGKLAPPVRTWMRSHVEEVRGKRILLIASNSGGSTVRLQQSFEKEFLPIDELLSVPIQLSEEQKLNKLEAFLGKS